MFVLSQHQVFLMAMTHPLILCVVFYKRSGAEVIHLGHNRSVEEVVNAAIQEDVQGIAISSYQGGHVEYFKYMNDLLVERGAPHIQIYGGGGGVIIPKEIKELHDYGISRYFLTRGRSKTWTPRNDQ